MKFFSMSILIILSCYITDFYNWVILSKTSKNILSYDKKLKYKTDAVKIYNNEKFNIFVFNPDKISFGVSQGKPSDVNFYMNSNFFNKTSIGLVVVDGKIKTNKVNGGGYFFVKNGTPNISVNSCPGNVEYASQSILWGINNGSPNNRLTKLCHAKIKTYRNMIGKNKYGNIIIVVSNNNGFVTIKEVINQGLELGIVNGVLFDGGSSVDYKYCDNQYKKEFKSLSGLLKILGNIDEPKTYIYGKLN